MADEETKNSEPIESVEAPDTDKTLLKPKKKRTVSEEVRKKRSEHMKAVNQVKREKSEKLKPKESKDLEVKTEESIKSVGLKDIVERPKKKKIIKIVNEPETEDDESEDEIVIVNRVQKSKYKSAQPKVPSKPEILCKFV